MRGDAQWNLSTANGRTDAAVEDDDPTLHDRVRRLERDVGSIGDLAIHERVRRLERQVRSIGGIIAAGIALGPAYAVYDVAANKLELWPWAAGLLAIAVWAAVGIYVW